MPKQRTQNDQGKTTFTAAGSGLNTPVAGKLSSKIGKSKAELEKERKPEKRIMGSDDAPRHTKGRWADGEMEAVASSLADEYPLVDEPLILAILADYSPDSFYEALPSVQDDLEMLQASAVPDSEQDNLGHYPSAPASSSQGIESNSTNDNGLGVTVDQQRSLQTSSRASSSSSRSAQLEVTNAKPPPPVVSRDFASNAPVKRYKTKRARSSIKILPRPSGRRSHSSFNKATQVHSASGNEASVSDASNLSASPESPIDEPEPPTTILTRMKSVEVIGNDDLSPSDIPHLTEHQVKTFVEVAPGVDPVEVYPEAVDTESDVRESDTETGGLTTDETDEDPLPEANFDPLKFLMEIFSSIPPSQIEEVYEKAKATGGDELEKAIEALLSVETIREVEERGCWSDDDREEAAEKSETDTSADEEVLPPTPAKSQFPPPKSELPPTKSETKPLRSESPPPKPKLARKKSPLLGPKPNDQPLSLTVPLYGGKVKASVVPASQPVATSNVISVVTSPARSPRPTGKKRQVPANLANRFANALNIEESQSAASSGDESAGSMKSTSSMSRRKRVQVDQTPIPTKVVSRPPPLVQRAATPRESNITVTESPVAPSFQLNSLASHLAELCGNEKATERHFLKYFGSPSYVSTFAAMKAALEAIAVPRSQVLQEIEMFKEISEASDEHAFMEKKDLELCVRATAGDIAEALDVARAMKDAMLSSADKPVWSTRVDDRPAPAVASSVPAENKAVNPALVFAPRLAFPPSPTYPQSKKPKSSKRSVEHPQNWRTIDKNLKPRKKGEQHHLADFIPAYGRGATPQDSRPGALYTDNEDILNYTMDECRRKVEQERERRKDALRNVIRYSSSNVKNNTGGVVAYYAEEARKANAKWNVLKLGAARGLVDKQSAKHDRYSIDIHHLTLEEAISVCKERVDAWHTAHKNVPTPPKPFRIITGVGKHSTNHVAILRPGVAKALENDGWRVDRGTSDRGYILVRGVQGA